MSANSNWSDEFLDELTEQAFRFAYMADQVRTGIALQIRAMREQPERKWKQDELGERMGKPQSTIARLENSDYGRVTLTTLLEVAKATDVALLVQFVEWNDFLERMKDVSPTALSKRSFDIASLKKPKPVPLQTSLELEEEGEEYRLPESEEDELIGDSLRILRGGQQQALRQDLQDYSAQPLAELARKRKQGISRFDGFPEVRRVSSM